MKYIDIAETKKQIKRISDSLEKPLLLIGGLAVNQYVITRHSQDIDLVCEFHTSRNIVENLYPSIEWNHDELNDDEYRPSFVIKHKHKIEYPTIKFGPKITERGLYKYLDWDELSNETSKFRYNKEHLNNIQVPSVEALCYMKVVSFIGRSESQIQKLKQDIWDIRELLNIDSFRLGVFKNFILKNDFVSEIEGKFYRRLQMIDETIDNCNLGLIVNLFYKSNVHNNLVSKSLKVEDKQNQENLKLKSNNSDIKLVVFDLDGTLIKGIRHSWTLLWNELKKDNKIQKERLGKFRRGEISYVEWTKLDCEDLIKLGLNKSHINKMIEDGKCSLTKNLVPAIEKLRENGVMTAIISGGFDTLLYGLLPQADTLFDEIFINKLIFSEDGNLCSISPTEYDWDDKKLGVVGKNRGLERICEKYDIPIEKTVFVGDDFNDIEAMKEAGTKIFYCGDSRELKNEQLPMGIILMPENDLMKVSDKVLSNSISELEID